MVLFGNIQAIGKLDPSPSWVSTLWSWMGTGSDKWFWFWPSSELVEVSKPGKERQGIFFFF